MAPFLFINVALGIVFAESLLQGSRTDIGHSVLQPEISGVVSMDQRRKELEVLVPLLLDEARSPVKAASAFLTRQADMRGGNRSQSQCIGSNTPDMIIVTLTAGLPESYVNLLRANRDMVVSSHNYKYCEYNHSLDTSRDAAWSKLVAVRHLISKQSKPVVWMDADAIFTQNKAFETITTEHFKTKDIVFTDDIRTDNTGHINTGVFVTKSNPWTQTFWTSVYNDYPEAITSPFWEQKAVILYMHKRPNEFHDHIDIVPHQMMNNVGEYSGDFIAHPAGGHNADKYVKLRHILEKQLSHKVPEPAEEEVDGEFISPERPEAESVLVYSQLATNQPIVTQPVKNTEETLDLMRQFHITGQCSNEGGAVDFMRIGAKNDGGYVICEHAALDSSFMISIGIRGEDPISTGISERFGVPAEQYDCFSGPSPCPDGSTRCNVHFNSVCAGGKEAVLEGRKFETLESMVLQGGSRTARHDSLILKIDCEGCEWETLAAVPESTLKQFRMILGEFHWLSQQAKHSEYLSVMKKLWKHHRLLHTHGCNCVDPGMLKVQDTEYRMPDIVEFLAIRKDLSVAAPHNGNKYLDLDAPVCKERPELTEKDWILPAVVRPV